MGSTERRAIHIRIGARNETGTWNWESKRHLFRQDLFSG